MYFWENCGKTLDLWARKAIDAQSLIRCGNWKDTAKNSQTLEVWAVRFQEDVWDPLKTLELFPVLIKNTEVEPLLSETADASKLG